MIHSMADKIARAVLYEGYILYPYRPSVKTRQRWTFGGVYPPAFSEAQNGTDAAFMQTQFLAIGDDQTMLEVEGRFLHLLDRAVGQFPEPLDAWPGGPEPVFTEVPSLEVGEKLHQPWQEAVERYIRLPRVRLTDLAARPVTLEFAFPATRALEPIRHADGGIVGVLVRRQHAVNGAVEVSAERVESTVDGIASLPSGTASTVEPTALSRHPERSEGSLLSREKEILRCAQDYGLRPSAAIGTDPRKGQDQGASHTYRITARISNQTSFQVAADVSRDDALLHCLVSTHALLGIEGGRLVSLTDPPEQLRQMAEACKNIGAWPVLVGEPGLDDTMLASPIILSDYPRVAPESPGDLFDSTEIDEILTLRIMTLSGREKREMAGIDERAAALLRRTESLAREQLMALHGTVRTCQPNLAEGHNE